MKLKTVRGKRAQPAVDIQRGPFCIDIRKEEQGHGWPQKYRGDISVWMFDFKTRNWRKLRNWLASLVKGLVCHLVSKEKQRGNKISFGRFRNQPKEMGKGKGRLFPSHHLFNMVFLAENDTLPTLTIHVIFLPSPTGGREGHSLIKLAGDPANFS